MKRKDLLTFAGAVILVIAVRAEVLTEPNDNDLLLASRQHQLRPGQRVKRIPATLLAKGEW